MDEKKLYEIVERYVWEKITDEDAEFLAELSKENPTLFYEKVTEYLKHVAVAKPQ